MQSCSQPGCGQDAAYRYTWPGREEAFACAGHAGHIKHAADAMGLTMPMRFLEPIDALKSNPGQTVTTPKRPEIRT